MTKKTVTVMVLAGLVVLIAVVPLFVRGGAGFGGSDTAARDMVHEIAGADYEPWADPVLETFLGGALPGELETLFFCIQTAIGAGVIAFCFGYLAAKKKYGHGEN
jgi:cobalt/nickel transport protein